MKKILSIILTILMVANFGLFATVSADGEATAVDFNGNATALLEVGIGKAQTTGTISGGYLTLVAGQSVTYKIVSDEATPVKLWLNTGAALTGTPTYNVTINGTEVATGKTLAAAGSSGAKCLYNAEDTRTFNFQNGENTVTFTVVSGSVSNINALYIADAEYKVAAQGETVIHTLSNVNLFTNSEYTNGDGENWYRPWKWTSTNQRAARLPWYDLYVEEAGNYDIFLPSQTNVSGVHEFNWAVTVSPTNTQGEGTTYSVANTSVAADGVYKAVTVPFVAGKNTIRLEWDGTLELGPQVSSVGVPGTKFKTFSIAPESAIPVSFTGNTANLLEVPVSNAITTGTTSSGGLTLAAGQSVTYKIVSDEATDVRLWWNNNVTDSSTTFDLSVNGTVQMTGAAMSVSASKSASIGKVSLAQGENTIVFTVKSGSVSGITTLYIADTEIKLSTTERTSIHALSTSNIFTYEEHLNSAANAYISLRSSNNLVQVARMPMYYLDVEEAGAYDIYLPSQNGTLLWDVWVNEAPTGCGQASATFVNTTVTTDGLHKAVTVNLNEGENYIYIAWNRDDSNKTSFANFTGFAIEKAADPNLVTATVTGTVAEGLAVSADLSNHDGNQVMAIVAVYKVKNGVKQLVASDVDTITATTTAHSLATAAVTAEDGYTYEYKVFVWNASTYAPYPVEIN